MKDSVEDYAVYNYVLFKFHWKPHEWAQLTRREKALVIASISLRIDEEKEAAKEAERKAKRARS
ncbi:hypothetical protein B5E95_00260 [Lactobacillus gallinarum]|uniref:Uncharacterized protein n=1 Tax=Lactobacillus gallinarum TaxID=52242 RepID=A0A1Y4UNF0_9LACO|nr:hypothetical protein B5E95_00260 [Lactobacillus gallinarum]OUQ58346.1 hypothetical protein B5E59_00740 [Lactobacillus gallinarum]OUQ75537.1 hypothetical protein B5E44_06945 [Lactobacillus gallinarum]